MKKCILLLFVAIFIVSCTDNKQAIDTTPPPVEISPTLDIVADDNIACHKVSDGSLVGDCPVDEFWNPYIPKEGGTKHDDTGTDDHLHDDDHEHADDVPPHRH